MGLRNGEGNGQAPTQAPSTAGGNDQASATAQANNSGSPSTAQNGQAPTATTQSSAFTPPTEAEWKRHQQELAEARRDAGKARDDAKKLTDAQLSAEEKRDRDFADMQTKNLEYEMRLQQQSLQLAGYRLGASLGISDIGAALALVQVEHAAEVKYADDGTPENISELLKAVLKDHPTLATQSSNGQQQRQASSGGATNPGANARAGVITQASWRAMSQQERIARNKEMLETLQRNGGHLPD